MKLKKLLIASAVASATLGLAATSAQAMTFKAYGQVDRSMVAADNGESTDVGFVDNSGSNTRFGFTGKQAINNGLTMGFKYEIAINNNTSGSWDINNNGTTASNFLDNRHADIFLSGNFGRLSFGKGSPAADGTSEVDYAGTHSFGGGNDAQDYAGGISLLDDDGNTLAQFGEAYSEFDAGRANRVRYDTPSFGGSVFSASVSEGSAYQAALRHETQFGNGGKVGFALAWVDTQDKGNVDDPLGHLKPGQNDKRYQQYGGSASVLLPSGFSVSGAYKHREYKHSVGIHDSDTANSYFAGLGYQTGQNHFSVGYGATKDLLNDGSKATTYNAAYVFDWTNAVKLYAGYNFIQLQDAYDSTLAKNVDSQNLNVLFVGTRIKFL